MTAEESVCDTEFVCERERKCLPTKHRQGQDVSVSVCERQTKCLPNKHRQGLEESVGV